MRLAAPRENDKSARHSDLSRKRMGWPVQASVGTASRAVTVRAGHARRAATMPISASALFIFDKTRERPDSYIARSRPKNRNARRHGPARPSSMQAPARFIIEEH
jgi:hypothetical protein